MTNDPRNVREDLRQKGLTQMLTSAVTSWESAVLIAFSLIMAAVNVQLFPGMQSWMWLAFGAVAEIVYIIARMNDPIANQQAVSQMFMEQYDWRDIRNTFARDKVRKAYEYKQNIDNYVSKQVGAMRESLSQTATAVNDWVALIWRLAKGIDQFESNDVVNRDRMQARTQLDNLQRRLRAETDEGVRHELEDAIRAQTQLVDSLKQIESNTKRSEIRMEKTVSQLSNIYTQMQLISSRQLDNSSARRIQDSIREEINELADIVSAMDDVYQNRYAGYTNPNSTAAQSVERLADVQDTVAGTDNQQDVQRGRLNG